MKFAVVSFIFPTQLHNLLKHVDPNPGDLDTTLMWVVVWNGLGGKREKIKV